MRLARVSICIGVCAGVAAGAPAAAPPGPAAAATATASVPPRARLTHFACQTALDPVSRSVSVRAVMRPLAGTRRLAVRLDLLQRLGSARPAVVRAGDLGVWVSPSNPTLGQLPGDVWRLDKTVIDLDAPATYQFRVVFRWTGPSGRVLGSAVRYSRKCRQPELRPDLAATSLTVTPVAGSPGQELYTTVIVNRGLTAAGPFEVLFVPGGSAAATTDSIPSLAAGQRLTLSFTGPVCNPADPPTVTADAAHEVDDYNRANNVATAVCPGS